MIRFCTLFSGSSGNSTFIGNDRAKILIDAGVTAKAIEQELRLIGEEPSDIDAILITHEHIDHTKGAGILSRRYGIKIVANSRTWRAMERDIGKIDPDLRVVSDELPGNFTVGGLETVPFHISHDAADPVGYTVMDRRRKITVATDSGCVSDTLFENLSGSDAVLLESNHDMNMLETGPYPAVLKARIRSDRGHLSNDSCAKAALKLVMSGTKVIILGHLSHENNVPEIAYGTVSKEIAEAGITIVSHSDVVPPDFFSSGPGSVDLLVAPRYGHSKMVLL